MKKCLHCNQEIEGRSNKIYCNDTCKSAAFKKRRALGEPPIKAELAPSYDTGNEVKTVGQIAHEDINRQLANKIAELQSVLERTQKSENELLQLVVLLEKQHEEKDKTIRQKEQTITHLTGQINHLNIIPGIEQEYAEMIVAFYDMVGKPLQKSDKQAFLERLEALSKKFLLNPMVQKYDVIWRIMDKIEGISKGSILTLSNESKILINKTLT